MKSLIKENPDAAVLVHPESPASVVALADVVGSTSKILNATREMPNKKFIESSLRLQRVVIVQPVKAVLPALG